MDGITIERLADIRERAEAKRWDYLDETEADRADLLAEVERLLVVAAAVLYLHRPVEVEPSGTICGHCSWQMPNGRFFGKVTEWPCPTAALLNPTEGEDR